MDDNEDIAPKGLLKDTIFSTQTQCICALVVGAVACIACITCGIVLTFLLVPLAVYPFSSRTSPIGIEVLALVANLVLTHCLKVCPTSIVCLSVGHSFRKIASSSTPTFDSSQVPAQVVRIIGARTPSQRSVWSFAMQQLPNFSYGVTTGQNTLQLSRLPQMPLSMPGGMSCISIASLSGH